MLPKEAYDRRDEFVFLDVRTANEWDAGHVEGAVHITLQQLPERFAELDRNRPIVAVCQIGQRSDLAARFLVDRGYEAHNLEGGLTMWADRGYPLVCGSEGGKVIDGWAETLEW